MYTKSGARSSEPVPQEFNCLLIRNIFVNIKLFKVLWMSHRMFGKYAKLEQPRVFLLG